MAYKDFEGYLSVETDKSIMKDVRGAHRTESLFNETIQWRSREKYPPLYSIRDYDYKGYISAYQIYMASTDEREAALKLVGSMTHWRKLCALDWFMNGRPECQHEGIVAWRKDMADRDASLAKKVIITQAELGNVPAARALEAMATKTSKGNSTKPKQAKAKSTSDSNVTDFLQRHEGK